MANNHFLNRANNVLFSKRKVYLGPTHAKTYIEYLRRFSVDFYFIPGKEVWVIGLN